MAATATNPGVGRATRSVGSICRQRGEPNEGLALPPPPPAAAATVVSAPPRRIPGSGVKLRPSFEKAERMTLVYLVDDVHNKQPTAATAYTRERDHCVVCMGACIDNSTCAQSLCMCACTAVTISSACLKMSDQLYTHPYIPERIVAASHVVASDYYDAFA